MKILIFSDSHRNVDPMIGAVSEEKPDVIFHLGDLESDALELNRKFPSIPLHSVPGNCDLMPFGIRRVIITEGGKKIFATHGHTYNVKAGLDGLINTAASAGADVVLFGHTHIPYFEEKAGMLVINPGSCGKGKHTYGVLTIENGKMDYELQECFSWDD